MAKLFINKEEKLGKINKEIYGHFSEHLGRCIYEGIYVGENSEIPNTNGMRKDVVEALKEMKLPVLRWPGGCFADEYHWMDGIGDKAKRKKMINTHWGGVVEDNSFGTHEFMELCKQIGCEVYINGNVGSGTVREMSEWVEYMTYDGISPMANLRAENGHKEAWKIEFFGVGNESWGCGGNMTPEYYANEYRRYQTYVRNYKEGEKIYKIACGPNAENFEWTQKVMEIAGNYMDGLSLHYYTLPTGNWQKKGSALAFDKKAYYETLSRTFFMEELLDGHSAIMDQYDKEGKVGLIVDEWGTWYDVEPGTNPGFLYQQNTMRDALVAGVNLNLFNKHCKRVKMANIAQLVNVLQAVILTEGEKMVLTPTYHVFHMYKAHQEGQLVQSYIETEDISYEDVKVRNLTESVSVDAQGVMHITFTNLSADESYPIEAVLTSQSITSVEAEIVTGAMDAHNTFDKAEQVKVEKFDAITIKHGGFELTIPPVSVMHITVK